MMMVFTTIPATRLCAALALVLPLALPLASGGCTSTPIQTDEGVTLVSVTPGELADAASRDEVPFEGTVLWGGVVLGVANDEDSSVIEVLAYPLSRVQQPLVGRPAQGRFVIVQPGYVEPLDYAAGRRVTVLGQLDGTVEGRIDQATRRFPRVLADELHLWRPGEVGEQPRFTFGLGIGIGN